MNPINIALCSFGMSGWVFHVPFLTNNPVFKLYGVWERSKYLSQKKYPVTKVFRKYEALLADSQAVLMIVYTTNVRNMNLSNRTRNGNNNTISIILIGRIIRLKKHQSLFQY